MISVSPERAAALGCVVLAAPLWVPVGAVGAIVWAGLRASRQYRGWYEEAWFAHGPGDTKPDLVRGDRVTALIGRRLAVSKALPDVVEQPRRPAYRVRPSGAYQPWFDAGPRFEARAVEVLEVVPGWRAFGPHGEAVVALLDAAMALPMAAYRAFDLEPPDPDLALEGLARSPRRREATSASLHAWLTVSQIVAPRDPDSGQMEHGYPVWIVSDPAWRNAIRAVQLTAIDIVLGHGGTDPTLGWEHLRAKINETPPDEPLEVHS